MPEDDLEHKVIAWLLKQGYPLEMRVADSFVRAGFNVVQSEHYNDPQSQTSREIDVSAYQQRDFDATFFRLEILIECKADKSKPWIVFTSERVGLADRARVVQRSATTLGYLWLREVSLRADVCGLSIFQLPTQTGYGVTAAFTEGYDVPYAALMGAATAARAEASSGDKAPQHGQKPFFSVQFPVVAIEAPLFVCRLGKDGTPHIEKTDRAVIAWRNPAYGMPHSIIHVIHASAIETFVAEVSDDFKFLMMNTEPEMRRAADRFADTAIPKKKPRARRRKAKQLEASKRA